MGAPGTDFIVKAILSRLGAAGEQATVRSAVEAEVAIFAPALLSKNPLGKAARTDAAITKFAEQLAVHGIDPKAVHGIMTPELIQAAKLAETQAAKAAKVAAPGRSQLAPLAFPIITAGVSAAVGPTLAQFGKDGAQGLILHNSASFLSIAEMRLFPYAVRGPSTDLEGNPLTAWFRLSGTFMGITEAESIALLSRQEQETSVAQITDKNEYLEKRSSERMARGPVGIFKDAKLLKEVYNVSESAKHAVTRALVAYKEEGIVVDPKVLKAAGVPVPPDTPAVPSTGNRGPRLMTLPPANIPPAVNNGEVIINGVRRNVIGTQP